MAIRPWFAASKITSRKHLITVTMLSFWTFYFVSNYITFNSPIPVAFYPLLALILLAATLLNVLALYSNKEHYELTPVRKGLGAGGEIVMG